MWKKLKSRGAETVEYAIVLACIAAFGLMFSDNLTHTLETLMGKTNSIITNGSTDKGDKDDETGKDDKEDKEDEKDKLEQEIEDNNLAWIKNLLACSKEKDPEKGFGTYLDNSIKTRKDLNFTNNDGLIDSGSNSVFVNKIEGMLDTNGIINGSSWAFAGYKEDKQKYYNVSIYTPAKNGGTSLADVKPGTPIKTDVYKVNADTGEVTKITDYPKQQIAAVRKNGNKSYIVIRDSDNK